MRVRRHVHRHARDRRAEVGAVVEIEPAKEELIGFALAAVLGDDDTRDGFQDFARRSSGRVSSCPAPMVP